MSMALTHRQLFHYGALGAPLAMGALPVYLHAPRLYADNLGLGLGLTGLIVLLARLVDAVQDPLLGRLSDKAGRVSALLLSGPVLGLALWGLFNPPALGGGTLALWLFLALVLASSAYSLAGISHNAWGAELSRDSHERSRITAAREGCALLGVLLASALPLLLGQDERSALSGFVWLYLPLLAAGLYLLLRLAPRAPATLRSGREAWAAWRALFANRRFRRLCLVLLGSATAASVGAALVLFYVEHVLRVPAQTPWFLLAYFLAGAAAMPPWLALARRLGKRGAWNAAMLLACASLVWVGLLGPGDGWLFGLICLLSGAALGADLALAPSLVADAMDHDPQAGAGDYFGLWSLLTKFSLALGVGISLPLVQALGFDPAAVDAQGAAALGWTYALLPCALKLLSLAALNLPLSDTPAHKPHLAMHPGKESSS